MPKFRYRAVAPGGEVIEAEMEAENRLTVIRRLQADNHLPIRAEEIGDAGGSAARAVTPEPLAGQPAAGIDLGRATLERIGARLGRRQAALLFAQSMASLLEARLTVDRALALLDDAEGDARVAALARHALVEVRGGLSLSAALAREGGIFDRFALALVRAGEAGGDLAEAFRRLAAYLQRARQVSETVRTALIYPAFLLAIAGVSIAILLTVVIPQFESIFREASRDLPLLTRVVFGVANLLRDWGWLLVAVVIAGGFLLHRSLKDPARRVAFDARVLSLPVIGRLILAVETERAARCLGALIAGGVDLPQALALAADTARNRAIAQALGSAARRVTEGQGFSGALAATPLPSIAVQLARVGEETGRLGPMLGEVADMHGREAEAGIKRLMAILEPALIIGLGLFVALIIVSVLVAMLGLNALAA